MSHSLKGHELEILELLKNPTDAEIFREDLNNLRDVVNEHMGDTENFQTRLWMSILRMGGYLGPMSEARFATYGDFRQQVIESNIANQRRRRHETPRSRRSLASRQQRCEP